MLSFVFLAFCSVGLLAVGVHNLPSDLGVCQVSFGVYVALDLLKEAVK